MATGSFTFHSKNWPATEPYILQERQIRIPSSSSDPSCPTSEQLTGYVLREQKIPRPLHTEVKSGIDSFLMSQLRSNLDSLAEESLKKACATPMGFRLNDAIAQNRAAEKKSKNSHLTLNEHLLNPFAEGALSSGQMLAVAQLECELAEEMLQLLRARDFELERLRRACETQLSLVTSASTRNTGNSGGGASTHDEKHLNLSMLNEKLRQTSTAYYDQVEALRHKQRQDYGDFLRKLVAGHSESEQDSTTATHHHRTIPTAAMHKSVSYDDSIHRRWLRGEANAHHQSTAQFSPSSSLSKSESFTIYLGAQLKSMHNVRITNCERLVDLCHHNYQNESVRLNTLISLYRRELAATVLLVDGDPFFHLKQKTAFARACEQSTELHFDPLEQQLKAVEVEVRKSNGTGKRTSWEDGAQHSSVFFPAHSKSESYTQPPSLNHGSLRPGDVYITRHSNLSSTQIVFHLVTDAAIASSDIPSRHPCIRGLHNIVRVASRSAVQSITLPLLLVEHLDSGCSIADEAATTTLSQWYLTRAELVFKCLKGFLMEACSLGSTVSNSNSAGGLVTANGINLASTTAHYTMNFAVPAQLSASQFQQLIDLFLSIYHMVPSVSA